MEWTDLNVERLTSELTSLNARLGQLSSVEWSEEEWDRLTTLRETARILVIQVNHLRRHR